MEQKNRKFAHEYQLQAVGRDINVKNPTNDSTINTETLQRADR
jgi:hypothetical protein